MQLTNSQEIAAFFLARLIAMAVTVVVSPLLVPIYLELSRSGSANLMGAVAYGMIAIGWLVTLALFLPLRGGFGGVPPRVGGGRRDAVTTSAGEIGAYFIALLITMVLGDLLGRVVLADVYPSLEQRGGVMATVPVSLGVSALLAVVFFLVFIAVRRAMPGVVPTEEPIETYDDGGAPMGFGRAIATCLCKYAVFRGRASRSEYWYFVLFEILLFVALMFVDMSGFRVDALARLAFLILFLPGLAVAVRRLHDVDMSGWWVVLGFVPLFGLYLIVWICDAGTKGPNRFGMGPSGEAIPEAFA